MLSLPALAQTAPAVHISNDPEHLDRLRAINRDIWTPFSAAYAANDAVQYLNLHTPDLIRATGGKYAGVQTLDEYGAGVRQGVARRVADSTGITIDFTFFERIAGEETASERGVYRLTVTPKVGEARQYYGKFHVFHRKVEGVWKIAVDYDSNEDGAIGAADFDAGLPPDVFPE